MNKEGNKEGGPEKLNTKNRRKIKTLRKAGEQEWQDTSLLDWPENDFRIYCCNLGNEVNEAILGTAFSKYASFAMCKVVRDKKTEKSRGFGFVSLLDVNDYMRAMKEMSGRYVGNRPITLTPSKWTEKTVDGGAGFISQSNRPKEILEFKQDATHPLTAKYGSLLSDKQREEIEAVLT
jgi:RNA recognition motif-containing protein